MCLTASSLEFENKSVFPVVTRNLTRIPNLAQNMTLRVHAENLHGAYDVYRCNIDEYIHEIKLNN